MNRLFGLLLSLSLIGAPPAWAAKEKGYYFYQKMLYQGDMKILCGQNGARVLTNGIAVYLTKNKKDAFAFNSINNKYCLLNRDIWLSKAATDATVENVKPWKTIEYKGHKVTEYAAKMISRDGKARWGIEFWAAKDFNIPQKVQDDYMHLVGLPSGYGIPLFIRRHNLDGRLETFLGTYEFKPTEFDSSELLPPFSKYKKVTDEMDVVLGDSEDALSKVLDEPTEAAPTKRAKGK